MVVKGWRDALSRALAVFGAVLLICSIAPISKADNFTSYQESRGRLAPPPGSIKSAGSLSQSPITLIGGSTLTLVSPPEWQSLGRELTSALQKTHAHFQNLVGEIPAFSTSLRLMGEETFYLGTGAPRWTNALFFRGQILIPLSKDSLQDLDNVTRSMQHEYTHAIVNALSGGRCPGWLDEGIAQWAEGAENPALRPALADYLRRSPPVPLSLLQGGFTKLETNMVAAAYAQSLLLARSVLDSFGFPALRSYLNKLRQGYDKNVAFIGAFGLSESQFEIRVGMQLKDWAEHFTQPRNQKNLL